MSQNSVTVLARDLLGCYVGDKFRVEDRYKTLGMDGLRAAMALLEERGAVALRGAVVTSLDVPMLWQASEFGTVVTLMQLPRSLRSQGMATGLQRAFIQAGIPFRLGFMRGATRRVDTLLEGRCDVIVASMMTARLDMEQGVPITLIHTFGFRSFAQEYVVAFRDTQVRQIVSGMRVALDPVSIDQTILTSYECQGKEVEFIEAPYVQSLDMLAAGELDAVVWSRDELKEWGLGFNLQPLRDPSPRRVAGEDTVAVLATGRDKTEMGGILAARLDFTAIHRTQLRVMKGEERSSY